MSVTTQTAVTHTTALFRSFPKITALTLACAALAPSAIAATATGNATATVMSAIAITADADLAFGGFLTTGNAGSVTIAPDGTRTATSVTLVASQPGAAGAFTVSGDNDATYAITLPADSTVTISDGTVTMAVDSFTSNPSGTGQLSATTGEQTLNVGATVSVGASQAANTYTGTYDVAVDYN